MVDTTQIRERATVVGSDGGHVGTVDHVDGPQIKLTKNDPDAGGLHHYIQIDLVASVEGDQVRLSKPADEVKSEWSTG